MPRWRRTRTNISISEATTTGPPSARTTPIGPSPKSRGSRPLTKHSPDRQAIAVPRAFLQRHEEHRALERPRLCRIFHSARQHNGYSLGHRRRDEQQLQHQSYQHRNDFVEQILSLCRRRPRRCQDNDRCTERQEHCCYQRELRKCLCAVALREL